MGRRPALFSSKATFIGTAVPHRGDRFAPIIRNAFYDVKPGSNTSHTPIATPEALDPQIVGLDFVVGA
jgi:hypothetical protein